jgi:DNA-binding NtrC family response regulator
MGCGVADIIVAEADPLHLDMVLTTLRRAGHSAVGFSSKDMCLARLKSGLFDLMVADYCIADFDGGAIAASLESQGLEMPVIGMVREGCGCRAEGAVAVLHKPFSPADLVVQVEKALAMVRGRQDACDG